MKCPYCNAQIRFSEVCPSCGKRISYGGNTQLYRSATQGKLGIKEIFSGTFKRHQPGDAMRSLSRRPLSGMNMLSSWQRPWMFLRLFAFLFLFAWLLVAFQDYSITFGTMGITVAAMVVPLMLMMFIWEMDIFGTVSIFDMVGLLLIGGVAACVLALEVNREINVRMFAYRAGLSEEPAKLLICVLFLLAKRRRKFYALDGLAIGAAVAAGFSFMETIQYAYLNTGVQTVVIRSIITLYGHVLYTAPFVGALCYVMNGQPLRLKHFGNPRFLSMLALGIGVHMFHNSNYHILILYYNDWILISVKSILLFLVTWSALLYMLRLGVNQALSVSDVYTAVGRQAVEDRRKATLSGCGGEYDGAMIPVFERAVVFGRDAGKCSLVFSSSDVSRIHCVVGPGKGGIEVRDLGSANGTRVNGHLLKKDVPQALHSGDILELGSGRERFDVIC